MAENDVSDRLIKSPSDGVIVYRLIDPGESAEKVKALFELIDVAPSVSVFSQYRAFRFIRVGRSCWS